MFSRTLLVALCIVYVTPLTPLASPGDDDCALYLTGPGRSSAYDYSLNLLKGNFAYDGQHTCITYEAINQAYLDARTRVLVAQPKGDWKAEHFASVGELMLDISISLARIYGLTYEEIEKGLPLIDTSRTLIREVCPPVFSHVECRAGKYRRLDGLCNNLRHPTWGAAMAPFQRLIGPLFADGINAPRISHTGRDLPLSRVVSRTMHPDDGFHDHAGTVMVIAWGQFMDHDYTLTGTPLDPVHRNDPEECCKRPPHLKHPYCNEIRVPDDDYFYRLFGVKCIDFVRGFPSPRPGCRLGSRVPFNTLTGAIDGNTVYGVTEKFARKLRTGYGGLLRMNPVFKEYGLKDLLPLKLDIPDEGCTRPNKNMFCFEAGEIRVNEQLVLTVMHTLMAREHNRVAEALAAVNPHWDDETLFQESRRINIAEIQHITYNEFLPILLGKDVMEKFGLVLEKEGYWDGYDENVNPDVIASFAAAAYRFGHSLLPTAVERWSKAHKFIASKRLSDLIRRPYDLYRAGVLDEYVMGLMNQVAQAMDDSITQEVTNHLFKKVGARFGMDLVSFNMQRGREFGLPGYMEFRKFCGLSGADSFQDLFGSMANETIQKYESIFEHPIDVDLWSGGVSERPLPGSILGPTFACIIATQFSYSRRGDRFWFELPNQPSSFTPEQIVELRKARLARVICDNTDIIDSVQLYPMVLPDHELNPRVPCRSGIIPSIDFSKWAEPTPFVGGAKEYMTDAHICNKTIQGDKNTAASRSDDCTINASNNFPEEQIDCKTEDIIIFDNNKDKKNDSETSNIENKNSDYVEANCENVSGSLDNKLANKVKNSDTVLKYVYKKNNINNSNKTRGHVKNSLRRKKRSLLSDSEILTHRQPRQFQINDHHRDREIAVPKTKPRGIVNKDDLADFNIETLHEIIKPSIDILMKDSQGYINNKKQNHIKKSESDENKSNEHIDRGKKYIKSTAYDDDDDDDDDSDDDSDDGTKYSKKSKNNDSEDIVKNGKTILKSDEYNKHDKNYEKNTKSPVYDNGRLNNDYSDESLNIENNSNENIKNRKEKAPQKDEDESSEYIAKDNKNIKSHHKNKDHRNNDYSKKSHNDKNESNEYEVKENNKSLDYENYNRNIDGRKKAENNEDYLTDYKDTLKIDENLDTDSSKERVSTSQNDISDENLDLLKKEPSYTSNENVNDIEETILNKDNEKNFTANKKRNNSNNFAEVILEDFSNENIQNEKDKNNAPFVDLFKSVENTASPENKEFLPNTLEKPFVEANSKKPQFIENVFNNEKQIKINDDEIKPVKELNNSESQSEEESKEYKESEESDDKEKSISDRLKSVIEKSQKLHPVPKTINEKDNGDVKAQFERIPENYTHTDVTSKTTEKEPVLENSDEEGTLDSLIPNNYQYDKDLNIKFNDLTIKLPEIKLPKDIIAYARETTKNDKEEYDNSEGKEKDDFGERDKQNSGDIEKENAEDKGRDNFGDIENDNSGEKEKEEEQEGEELEEYGKNSKKHRNNKQNGEDFYNSYFNPPSIGLPDDYPQKKENYFNFNNDNSGEDLYEKFVRERFGKRKDLNKKSDKLRDYEPVSKDYNLFKTVRKVLKRANNIEEEAEKSKDPNYMWTLEYGGKL